MDSDGAARSEKFYELKNNKGGWNAVITSSTLAVGKKRLKTKMMNKLGIILLSSVVHLGPLTC